LLTLGEGRAVSFEKGLSTAGAEGVVDTGFGFVTLIFGVGTDSAISVGAGAGVEEEVPPLSAFCSDFGVEDPDSFSSRRRRIYSYVSHVDFQYLNARTWSIFSLSGASGGGGCC
jgi:hypothetical protein